jgi:putative flippase GtrA
MIPTFHRRRFARFVIVGCSNALIGYGVFSFLIRSGLFPDHLRIVLSQVCSYASGVIWAFFWSRGWAFDDAESAAPSLHGQAFRFALLQIWSMILSVALVGMLIEHLGWPPSAGWISAMSVVTVVHYAGMSVWVFPPAKRARVGTGLEAR